MTLNISSEGNDCLTNELLKASHNSHNHESLLVSLAKHQQNYKEWLEAAMLLIYCLQINFLDLNIK